MNVKILYRIVVFVFSILNCLVFAGVLTSSFSRFSLLAVIMIILPIKKNIQEDIKNKVANKKMIFLDVSIILFWVVTVIGAVLK